MSANNKKLSLRKFMRYICIDASTSDIPKDQDERYPVRHPKLPITVPPRYFVNKRAFVCSNTSGKLKLIKPDKRGRMVNYRFHIDKRTQTSIKLREIMAYTFWEQPFDSSLHWIYHKDGNKENCAWDNLIVCDLPTIQQLEIKRLEKLNPGTKYTVVRNIHDTLTFERYLVSDAGKVYSLIKRRYLSTEKKSDRESYHAVTLAFDIGAVQTIPKSRNFKVHCIVIQSFKGRRIKGFVIDHRNGDKLDNSFLNLDFVTAYENSQRAYRSEQKEARERRTKQELVPKKRVARPLPPITKETKWKPVGFLPWIGRSFNHYEVLDMGHVRKAVDQRVLKLTCRECGRFQIRISCNSQVANDDSLARKCAQKWTLYVFRLVADAFVEGYSETQNIVNHVHNDSGDNRAQNLRWVPKNCTTLNGVAHRVVAALVDDPDTRKEYPSKKGAQIDLRTRLSGVKPGESTKRFVNRNGERKIALLHIL